MKLKKGDVALRGNFSTVDRNLVIIDRRAGRIQKTEPLIKILNGIVIDGIRFLLARGVSHRIAVVLRGKGLSDEISDNDLHKVGIAISAIRPLSKKKSAVFTSEVLNKFLKKSHQILENASLNKRREKQGLLPANYILLRGAGKFKKIESFYKKWRLKACCVAGGSLYKGIAKALGMDIIEVKGATGKSDTNIGGKLRAAKKALKDYDFCFLHIKATDNFGHDGDCLGKKKFIEKIDKNLSLLFKLKNTLIIITSDHSTPCEIKEHSSDPVPVLIYGAGKDKVKKFSERHCKEGALGKIKSIDLLKTAVKMK